MQNALGSQSSKCKLGKNEASAPRLMMTVKVLVLSLDRFVVLVEGLRMQGCRGVALK